MSTRPWQAQAWQSSSESALPDSRRIANSARFPLPRDLAQRVGLTRPTLARFLHLKSAHKGLLTSRPARNAASFDSRRSCLDNSTR